MSEDTGNGTAIDRTAAIRALQEDQEDRKAAFSVEIEALMEKHGVSLVAKPFINQEGRLDAHILINVRQP